MSKPEYVSESELGSMFTLWPESVPEVSARIEICRCGHPVEDHYLGDGCRAAESQRPESLGGGVGTSRCECPEGKMLLTVSRKYTSRFRQSPIKGHALRRALESMRRAGPEAVADVEWDESQLVCAFGAVTGVPGAGEKCTNVLIPMYLDREATQTSLACEYHEAVMVTRGVGYRKVRAHLTKKQREERITRHIEAMNDFSYRKARGMVASNRALDSMGEALRRAERETK